MNRRGFLSTLGLSSLLIGCSQSSQDRTAIKFGMSTPSDPTRNGVYVWAQAFISVLSQAGFQIQVFPSSSIGGERERMFQVQMGLLETNSTGGDEVNRWSPLAAASARPFLIESYDHLDRLLTQTPYLEQVSNDFQVHGFRLADIVNTGSMVGLFSRGTPVRRLEDLRMLRLRVLSSADMDLLNAWDARGVQVAWEEVAQALQTGMVDAYLNPPNVAPMFGHGSVLDYFTDLGLGPAIRLVVISQLWFDSLSPSQQGSVNDAITAGRQANRLWTANAIRLDRERLISTGIEWITPTPDERQEWIDASQAIPPGRWETPTATTQFTQWVEATRELNN